MLLLYFTCIPQRNEISQAELIKKNIFMRFIHIEFCCRYSICIEIDTIEKESSYLLRGNRN